MGNYIVIRDYNITVLTMKVIALFISFLQNIMRQTTNKAEFLQPPPFQMKSQFLPPVPFLLFRQKVIISTTQLYFGKLAPLPLHLYEGRGFRLAKIREMNGCMHTSNTARFCLPRLPRRERGSGVIRIKDCVERNKKAQHAYVQESNK